MLDDSVFLDPNPAEACKARIGIALAAHVERQKNLSPSERKKQEEKRARADREDARKASGRAKPANHNKRTADLWQERGCAFEIVERWNAFAGVKNDLFGCIDAIACGPDHGLVGVQITSKGNIAARMTKARASKGLAKWLEGGGKFVVIGWAKNASGRYEVEERWL